MATKGQNRAKTRRAQRRALARFDGTRISGRKIARFRFGGGISRSKLSLGRRATEASSSEESRSG